ncbi:MAG: sugar ABC transporter permease [Acidimicrobiia bacterium]|nr:sugar ABC transporter permease [Acidimicrobiia bacterium]MBT8247589.1 sugar ABC transporter permease [Acidimicrobiia bacterium]NNF89023.1 sugar ABC transporter permease [Acidimicrobiia bacterium]NNJ46886.1 sugar ABC transporter permease [Acidimicrobiia bacterium]NNL12145.1 sugar ABC transporter permease [Acidimicrobiia bacterium]
MLILGLIAAALLGPLFVWRTNDNPSVQRYGIASAVAVAGAAVTPLAMGQCGFSSVATGVDHLLAYGLMATASLLALLGARALFDRADGKKVTSGAMTGEISTGGFRMGWWVPWVLLSPTLVILVVFLYAPAVQTFTLSTQLTRLGAPKSIDVCFGNFSELLITDPFKLVAYPLLAIGAVYAARFFVRRTSPGTAGRRWADLAAVVAMLSVFVALYAMFSPGGGGQVAYRPVYLNTVIISVGIVALGMSGGLAIAYLAFRQIGGGAIYRTLLIWPYAISPAVAGVLFFMIFDPTAGIFQHSMEVVFGIDVPNYRENAVLAQTAIILASAWKILGYNILFYLAGLQTVPIDQIEAAIIDGAGTWQRFKKVVLPALSPMTFFLLVTNLTYAFFEVYATIDFMTKGAPAGKTSVAIYEIIRVGVNNGDLGRGAAQSVLLFIAIIGITLWQFRTSGSRVSYGGS